MSTMKARITGTTLPVLEIGLEQGDKVISEPGQFSWMSANINLQTTARTAGAKGIFGVLGRALSGGGLFMNEYQTTGGQGMVAFAAKVPGAI
ncbi:MAG TPA: AIM24 family protein, partial [Burkholderiaceae bacterium]|nr:AIM24 family protein [Burkholderiaceae bacterium]